MTDLNPRIFLPLPFLRVLRVLRASALGLIFSEDNNNE